MKRQNLIPMNHPIALLTDFGLEDHYVGSLKGVILKINRRATIFDITHDIAPQNIRQAAFVLKAAYPALPGGAIITAVVDPGVGSARQAICIKTTKGYLIGPNNGIFSMILREEEKYEVRAITNDRYFHQPVSSTFHGRDIFAPAAAWLSKGDIFKILGSRVREVHQFRIPEPKRKANVLQGEIIYTDHFGNAITNINSCLLERKPKAANISIVVKGKYRADLKPFFSVGKLGKLIAVWNSGDLLELAIREDSAEKLFGLQVGDLVEVWLK